MVFLKIPYGRPELVSGSQETNSVHTLFKMLKQVQDDRKGALE
ncbi:MAG: hypothetical protein NWP47_03490 [Rickettsiaceae bacterium]|nr:hypothetical protein [Rickettsiaceae bacterium]